ncbi:MAG: hypothetical protein EZS28_055725, partial [Streblomastix strix]
MLYIYQFGVDISDVIEKVEEENLSNDEVEDDEEDDDDDDDVKDPQFNDVKEMSLSGMNSTKLEDALISSDSPIDPKL